MRHAQRSRLFVRVAAICTAVVIAGCADKAPPQPGFIPADLPDPPAACVAPATPEPKLDKRHDVDDLAAVKDRSKLKDAFRAERNLRRSCGEQLRTLLQAK